jgi:hypothetical protein
MPYKDKTKKREYQKQYREKNKEYFKQHKKRWRQENKEKLKKYYQENRENIVLRKKVYYQKHREENIEYARKYRGINKDIIKQHGKQYEIDNKEKRKEKNRKWRENNPEYYKQWSAKRRKTDLKYNLNRKISKGIYKSLKANKEGRHWEFLVGYALNELIKHLKKTMPKGYKWSDYLNGDLHIDHIIPISVFNFDSPENPDFKNCWALENLRLLPASENLLKRDKISKPFQPALKIMRYKYKHTSAFKILQ